MTTTSRDRAMTASFSAPWAYPGLPLRSAISCCLHFGEAHHLLWRSWSIFDDGQLVVARRIEWPCAAGKRSQTGTFTHTFAAECLIDRQFAGSLIADAITAARCRAPTQDQACGIDGAQRRVQIGQASEHATVNWEKAATDSLLDVWFDRAADVLNKRLPESSANAYYLLGPEDISSKAASDPRQP